MLVTNQLNHSITLINVFTGTPEKHNIVADKIAHIYKTFVCHQPGFISATIQKSLDGAKVAQWESQAALSTMQQNADFHHLLKLIDGEIISAEPHLYETIAPIGS